MKRLSLLISLAAICLMALSLSAGEAAKPGATNGLLAATTIKTDPSGLVWYPYPDALKKSKKENKHLMVHFTATWCGWCKKMEKETYTDTTITKLLAKDFVLSKVWGDQDSLFDIDGYQISERLLGQTQYGVRSFPTLAFKSPEGTNLGTLPGYQDAANLMKVLEFVRDRKYDTTRTQTQKPADSTGK